MGNSTPSTDTRKADKKPSQADFVKPSANFPLSFHPPSGRLYKKIRGHRHYFGYASDWKAALAEYERVAVDLHAGRTPRDKGDDEALTLGDLCNRFLTTKRDLLTTGEITDITFRDYHVICKKIVEAFGRNRLVDDLSPSDFETLRNRLAENYGPVSLGNAIGRVRMLFKYAYDQGLTDRPTRYGQGFKKPTRKTLRKERAKGGKRMFEAEELRAMLDAAGVPLKAMLLLGINCGMGQTDVARLPQSAIDLDGGWIDYARAKTGVERRCPLWPETVQALREAIAERPKPKSEADADLCFVTKYGNAWTRHLDPDGGLTGKETEAEAQLHRDKRRGLSVDSIATTTSRLLTKLKLKRGRLNFYAARHTFQTVAERCRDLPAVSAVMGHVDASMSGVYREEFTDERLKHVTDTVRAWLFPAETEGGDK